MEIVFEILLEVYMELMLLIVPEEKRRKKHYVFATVLAVLLTIGLLALGFYGVWLIAVRDSVWGVLPLCVVVVLSALQIGFGIKLYGKRNSKK